MSDNTATDLIVDKVGGIHSVNRLMDGQVYSWRLPKYVTGYRIPHKTGDFLPYVGNDVGVWIWREP